MTERLFAIAIPSRAGELPEVMQKIEVIASKSGFGDREIMYLSSSLYEALTNAIEHGNGSEEKRMVQIEVIRRVNGIDLKVRDEGEGFSPDNVRDPGREEGIFNGRGRGVFMMNKMMDSVRYNDKGNEVTLSLTLKEKTL